MMSGSVTAAAQMLGRTGAIVLECHNMAPFSRRVARTFGIPVYDVYTLVTWFHAGLAPRDFGPPGSAPGHADWRER